MLRVAEALKDLKGVGAVYVGVGPLNPNGSHVRFRGILPHHSIPEILSASGSINTKPRKVYKEPRPLFTITVHPENCIGSLT